MLTQLEIKNIKRIAASVVGFRAAMEAAQAKADAIDEKYRKMAEEKKGTLVQDIANLEAEIEFWQAAIVQRYGDEATPILNEIFGEGESSEEMDADDMKEDVVVDPNPEAIPAKEEKEEEPVEDDLFSGDGDAEDGGGVPVEEPEEPKDPDAEEDADRDQKIESSELTEVETPETDESADNNWEETTEEENEQNEDDDWQMPEEWK